MKRTMMAACILSLVACGGSKDDVATDQQRDWESQRQSLVYSFPDQGQLEVPVPSPVVLRFSSPVAETAPAIELREVGGAVVSDVALEWVDGKRGLIITPQNKLKPLTDYVVDVPAIELEKGEASARSIQFTTRALHEGPRSLVARDTFEVVRTIPDGVNFAVTDFASFRLQFSQPLDPSTVKYGDAGDSTVQLMGPEGLVDAHLLVSGAYITVDPKEDLTPGGDYSLNITGGLTSVYGDNLTGGGLSNPMPYTLTAKPVDTTSPTTGKRVSMVQDIADTGEISPLTGKPINLVPMASVLLGEETATQASGTIAAELAFVPNFPDQTPLRIKRGSLIEGASIDVLIGGEVPAGFESGAVRMDFLSDATGYLLPNEYSKSDDAPRQVRLWMDVAVSTETPAANGAITQDLLHIELVGTSIVEDGQMVINAVGVVEPNVLGSERATGLLSFYMKAYEDQDNPPATTPVPKPLELVSWLPGENAESHGPRDPLVLYFNSPVDAESVQQRVALIERSDFGMRQVAASISVKGSSIVIQPEDGIKRPVQVSATSLESYEYEITLEPGIKDVQGNDIVLNGQSLAFSLSPLVTIGTAYYPLWAPGTPGVDGWDVGFEQQVRVQSPVVIFSYPSFPCVLDETTTDLANGIAGRCVAGLAESFTSRSGEITKNADDYIYLQDLPSDRPIVIHFSREIDPKSVTLNGNFIVSSLDEDNLPMANVSGRLEFSGKRLMFYPDQPWEDGLIYQYELVSNGDLMRATNPVVCDGSGAICDFDGLPLQTQIYVTEKSPGEDINQGIADGAAGGPSMKGYFRGAPKSANVFLAMTGKSADTNANFYHEKNYERPTFDLHGGDVNYREFAFEERGADEALPELNPHENDVDGLQPPENSAKIISLSAGAEFDGTLLINGLNVGCGWSSYAPDYVTQVCPEKKFTYLTSAVGAEVTSVVDADKGVKVLLWPGQIMSTAVTMYAIIGDSMNMGLDSSPMLMRMRYAKEDDSCVEQFGSPCVRNKPITAWIKDDPVTGKPRLSASIDMYVDAIGLVDGIESIGMLGFRHNLVSVPVTMDLSGEISFLESGQMLVEQVNLNDVLIHFELEAGVTMADVSLLVPENGARVVYTSDIID